MGGENDVNRYEWLQLLIAAATLIIAIVDLMHGW